MRFAPPKTLPFVRGTVFLMVLSNPAVCPSAATIRRSVPWRPSARPRGSGSSGSALLGGPALIEAVGQDSDLSATKARNLKPELGLAGARRKTGRQAGSKEAKVDAHPRCTLYRSIN